MLLPHRVLLIALAAWFGLAVLAAVWPSWLAVWQFAGAALLSAALADGWLALSRRNPVRVEREIEDAWPVGVTQTVRLRLASPERSVAGWVFDRHPETFSAEGLPLFFKLSRGHWAKLGYMAQPLERGPHVFGGIELRLLSPLRLWLTQYRVGGDETVRVYPDFEKITRYSVFATDNRLSQIGVLRRRRRGEGLDFHQLREYCRDDALRQIDWKATARKRKPIAREYQDERDQNIVFLLDCGQRMRAKDDALSHFDHTLNALLLLSYVALRQGDGVGLSTFAQAEPRYFAPRKSLVTVQRLLNAVHDLQPSLQTPDYLIASQALCERLSKRSLIVLLTNLRDEDESTLPPALAILRRRHLVLLANLRETSLDALLHEPVTDLDGALAYAAAVDYRRERRRQLAALRAQGVAVLDVAPAELPVALVNRYWDMKRSGVF
ncbi:DUF58 domain-containing protein [Methylocaldum sp. GT1TLB]|uniref:DUF58 domain-containing protein n=1 Tax=Methylocaldum sp. GT1TLB TaxID=3438965 RepID=UPI001ECF9E0A|nr:DUF58 domain-containing protein [Methylocaldum sp. BRCS4]